MQTLGNGGFIMTNLQVKKMIAECEKNAPKDTEIDFSEIPEITDFSGFRLRNFKPKKQIITCSVDKDIILWLKADGKGYQTRLNAALRGAKENHCPLLDYAEITHQR